MISAPFLVISVRMPKQTWMEVGSREVSVFHNENGTEEQSLIRKKKKRMRLKIESFIYNLKI